MINYHALAMISLSAATLTFVAASPLTLSDVAPSEDWVAEAEDRLKSLEDRLADADSFEEDADRIDQDAGVLAVMAQALVEQPAEGSKIQAAVLRDAAIKIWKAESLKDAKAAYEIAKAALAGESHEQAEKDYDWGKLIGMHAMMEEINGSNAALRRGLRRLRRPEEEARRAGVLATLAVAMHADTHEVKDPADLPRWNALAAQYQAAMSDLAAAIREEDQEKAMEIFAVANERCDACHEVFQD